MTIHEVRIAGWRIGFWRFGLVLMTPRHAWCWDYHRPFSLWRD
jgi:hypothetical protein